MELQIKPYHSNIYPLAGVLIKGESPVFWLKEIQKLELSLDAIEVYALPGKIANSVWGCLLVLNAEQQIKDIGKHEFCQLVHQLVFIPERSILQPALTIGDIEKLFRSKKHLFFPDIGMVELEAAIDWKTLIESPEVKQPYVFEPEPPGFIPSKIRSFQIQGVPTEEVLKNLEDKTFPKKEKFKDKPLNLFEKGKLFLYKNLFRGSGTNKQGNWSGGKPSKFLEGLGNLMGKIMPQNANWINRLENDFEALEKRNQKHINKLLDMLKNDPEEALKYAIPLDEGGTGRGGFGGEFSWLSRWGDFSLFGNNRGSGSGPMIDIGDHFYDLRKQYLDTAQKLIQKGEHKKAAFIYLKLLKDYTAAAKAMEAGGFYQEAASIYLKFLQNKSKAAECYEKGSFINKAIELYKDLNENEKVGDLYLKIDKVEEAHVYFEKVVDAYKRRNQYVKASLIYKNKMNNDPAGQGLLLEGWRLNKDAFNCLNNYFNNIHDQKILLEQINSVYKEDVNDANTLNFLKAIKFEYKKNKELATPIRDMAYELIAARVKTNPAVVSELVDFNQPDDELLRDTIWFKSRR